MLNLVEARTHFSHLHNCAGRLEGKLILASFGENIPPIVKQFSIGDVDGMVNAAQELAQQPKRNVYSPLAVMRHDLPLSSKGTEKDILAILGFVADFDNGTGKDYWIRCPIQPSYVLETSPGNAQCFFMLDKPLMIHNDADRVYAKELAVRLTQSCIGADSCGSDISHVWRVPGLMNHPNSKKLREGRDPDPFIVRALNPFDGIYVSQSQIQTMPVATNTLPETSLANAQLEYSKPVDLKDLENKGLHSVVSLIVNPTKTGERSEAVGRVVWELLRQNYTTGDIVNIIAEHPKGIGERYNNNLNRIEDDVLRLAGKKLEVGTHYIKQAYCLQNIGVIDEAAIPARAWILGRQLLRGHVTVIIAPPGVGKSTASLAWAMSVATNRELLGLSVHESGAVGVINNEDDMDEMKRRIMAIQKYYKITSSELEGRFFLQSGAIQQFTIAKRDSGGKGVTPHHKDDLIAFCLKHKITALFIDPFLETHEADENDNRQINEVARMYREVAQKANCAVCLIHHTRKQQGQSSNGHAGNADSGRGASSLVGVARIVSTLYDMSEGDAKLYGVAEHERFLYIRLDDAKANLSLKSDQALWYRRETVNLSNGDSMGVLSVASHLQNAMALKQVTQAGLLIAAIKDHDAFEDLRVSGKLKREAFVAAMLKAKVYLGAQTKTRSTLQERVVSQLLGDGITDGSVRVWMRKHDGRFTIYTDLDSAGLPEIALKIPAVPLQSQSLRYMPPPADTFRHNAL